MPNLFRSTYPLWWVPNFDTATCPPEGLLRADNLVPDEGMPRLRLGSTKLNTTAIGSPSQITSLFTAKLDGTRVRVAGADNGKVYVVSTTPSLLDTPTFDGSGDIIMGAAMGRILMARGTTTQEYDGSTVASWDIAAPTMAPTVTAVNAFTKEVASCDQAEAPGFTAEEGSITATYPTGEDGTANGSIELTPAATGRATIIKTFSATTDYYNLNGYTGSDFDLFDLPVWITEPEKVTSVTVMFGLSTTTDKFQTDYYTFDFDLGAIETSINTTFKSPNSLQQGVADAVINVAARKAKKRAADAESSLTNEDRRDIDDRIVKPRRGDERQSRRDAASNPGWTHLACLRSQFRRVGSTAGLDWTQVKAFKIVYKATAGATGKVRFDSIKFHGGGNEKALTGTFKFVYRYARNCGDFWKVSPESPESAEIILNTQAVSLGIPLPAATSMDQQTDEIWVYIFGGVLDRYYRTDNSVDAAGISPLGYQRTIRAFEYDKTAQGASTAADRTRRTTFGYAIPTAPTSTAISIEVLANQADLFIANDYLEIGTSGPPDNVVGIVGDHHFRTFCLTAKKLIPSLPRNPASFLAGKAIAVGSDDETAYWVAKGTGGLYVGTSVDIYQIAGDGQEFPDGTLNFSREPLNIAFPPTSSAFALEGNQIIYMAADGWRAFDGQYSLPVNRDSVDLLYRGYTRHGVSPVNLSTGRFRAALSGGVLNAITPEGASTTSSTALHRFDSGRKIWRRDTYPHSMTAIHREPDGTVIFGDTLGFVRTLDTGTQDDSTNIAVVLWTPSDDDGTPSNKKDPYDEFIRINTGGSTATVAHHIGGSDTQYASFSVASTGDAADIYKKALKTADDSGWAAFRRIQHRITGSFSIFKLYSLNLAYRLRPQERMFVDTGYLDFKGDGDLVWLRELILKVDSPNNLTVKVYMDDVLASLNTLTVTANAARPYTIQLKDSLGTSPGREIKGYQPRITIETTNSAGVSDIGFETYWLKVKYRPSGNKETDKLFHWSLPGYDGAA